MRTEPDGQTVNIPSLFACAMEGRSVVYDSHNWICVRVIRTILRKIRGLPLMVSSSKAGMHWVTSVKFIKHASEKNF